MTRILVVDDDPDFLEITRLILTSQGHQVDVALHGDAGLEAMRRSKPDLVVLDVMMASVLDGLSVAHTMSNDPTLKSIPVIMVSSISSSDQASLFPTDEYLPIDMWISKPVQPSALTRAVSRLLEGAGTG